jgi:prepilin-type processing-associated H-X9-DG protein
MPRHEDEYDARAREPRPRRKNTGLIVILVVVSVLVVVCSGGLIAAVFFSTSRVRDAANRIQSNHNLKQIALGIHNYNDNNNELPGNSYGPDGKPLLSWRVHLLPYVEEERLYRQFNLDEPWDSPNNIRLLSQMPKLYAHPRDRHNVGVSVTYYRGFSSPGAVFEKRARASNPVGPIVGGPAVLLKKDDPFNLSSFKDNPAETLLVVEAGDPVEWTKPDDLDASPGKPFPALGGMGWSGNRFNVALADGSVRTLKPGIPETTLRALVTHSGGEKLPIDWDQ